MSNVNEIIIKHFRVFGNSVLRIFDDKISGIAVADSFLLMFIIGKKCQGLVRYS